MAVFTPLLQLSAAGGQVFHTTLAANNLYSTGVTIRESKVEEMRPPMRNLRYI